MAPHNINMSDIGFCLFLLVNCLFLLWVLESPDVLFWLALWAMGLLAFFTFNIYRATQQTAQ